MKPAIVTGATGMIARALIRCLVSHEVAVFALKKPGDPLNDEIFNSELVTVVEADISSLPAAAAQIDKPCSVLYHFAWLGTFGSSRDDAYLQNDNIRYTLDAVRLASLTGCEAFVGAGSQAECGTLSGKLGMDAPTAPVTGYGIAKFTAGKLSRLYAEALGLRHCWTRILSVYGIGANPDTLLPSAILKMLRGEHAAFTKGEQIWDFLYCDDCAEAFFAIGKNGRHGSCYPIGSGEARSLADYICAARDAVDPSIKIGIGELPYNPNQVMYLCADITQLTEDTGFVPSVSFEEGIARVVESLRASI